MILIQSHLGDLHTRRVLEALQRCDARVFVFDNARFPDGLGLSVRNGADGGLATTLHDPAGGDLDLRRVRVIWLRRPQPLHISPSIRDIEDRRFTLNEASEALNGLWEILDAFWVNSPARDQAAHRKLLQLQVAEAVGLPCPRTLVTSNPDEARAFISKNSPSATVYKAFSATPARWRETRIIQPEELGRLDSVRHCPVIFQEFVPAVCDLRVTVVGDELFVGEVRSPEGGYAYDYRMDLDAAVISKGKLLPETEAKLRVLMSRLGLVYGAIDLRRTPDGAEVFLEINPAGQWLFVEDKTGLPITEALASLLAGRSR